MIILKSDEPNLQARPLWKREDYKTATSALMCLQQEHGEGIPHIPNMRTRQHNTLDLTIQRNFAMARPELANVLLDTDFILFWVTVAKFSTVARVANRRMARPKVAGDMVSEDNRRFVFNYFQEAGANIVSIVAKVASSFKISLQYCTFTSHVVVASRHW